LYDVTEYEAVAGWRRGCWSCSECVSWNSQWHAWSVCHRRAIRLQQLTARLRVSLHSTLTPPVNCVR